MPMPPNLEKMGSSLLIEHIIQLAGERGILQVSDAPIEELTEVQGKLDAATEVLQRRMSW